MEESGGSVVEEAVPGRTSAAAVVADADDAAAAAEDDAVGGLLCEDAGRPEASSAGEGRKDSGARKDWLSPAGVVEVDS